MTNPPSETLSLAMALIRRPSVTPDDQGCQQLIGDLLLDAGFNITPILSGSVTNMWATHGSGQPCIMFAGHTDVVPPGDDRDWTTPPFVAACRDGHLFGRGAADMKGSLSSAIIAAIKYVKANPNHPGTIALGITSDEEGPAQDGSVKIVEYLKKNNIPVHYCITAEPTCHTELGDIVKIGRRGSLHGNLTIYGTQSHIAYPLENENPIHLAGEIISAICSIQLDEGTAQFPPSTLQFSNISAGVGANNVTPATLSAQFNIRFAPARTVHELQQQITTIIDRFPVRYDLDWQYACRAFLSPDGKLKHTAQHVIKKHCQVDPDFNTIGGSSDSRFFATLGAEIIDFGPINTSMHRVDECVLIEDLNRLTCIYQDMLTSLLA